MALQIGIVGLPNVGKSTLFNALTKSKAANVANYPFCTIDPNVGVVEVPDRRLNKLAEMVSPKRIVPATVEFKDIAGLVKGASEGEGLGNAFLANIRECDAIAQVVRVFRDDNVIHVHGTIDPKSDIEVIQSELLLADLQTLEKRLSRARSEIKSGNEKAAAYLDMLQKLKVHLERGLLAFTFLAGEEAASHLKDLHLLTNKPILYIANVDEADIATSQGPDLASKLGLSVGATVIPISAKIEAELGQMAESEAEVFLADLGMHEPGLNTLIRKAYEILGFLTFFTAGPLEVRAWTTVKGATAPQAAGVIHTDFEKGFIAAEVISYDDYVQFGGEVGAREKGKARVEGKTYVMKDGDVVHFRFNI